MATVSLSTSPTTLDDGTAYMVQVTNTGTDIVALSRSGIQLKAGQGTTIYPEGIALTATAPGGTGSVTTTATAKPPGQADTFLSKADATATYLTQVAANATYVQVLTPASTYTWNPDGTLATVTLGGVTTAYTWNPDGTLASEARSGVTRAFTWNADGTLAAVA